MTESIRLVTAVPLEDHKAALACIDELLIALQDATYNAVHTSYGRDGVIARCQMCVGTARGTDVQQAESAVEHDAKCPRGVFVRYEKLGSS